jgi:hypothetical protein
MPIITLAQARALPHNTGAMSCSTAMGDEIQTGARSFGPIRPATMQSAAIVIGIAAFFVSPQPAGSAKRLTRPSGALLLENRKAAELKTIAGPTLLMLSLILFSSTGAGLRHLDAG